MDRNGKHCVTSFSMNVRNVYCLKSIIFDHILKVFFLSCIDYIRMEKKCQMKLEYFLTYFFCVQIHNNVHVKRNIDVYLCDFYRRNENARGEGSSQWKCQESQ